MFQLLEIGGLMYRLNVQTGETWRLVVSGWELIAEPSIAKVAKVEVPKITTAPRD